MSTRKIDKIDIIVRLPGEPLRCGLIACEDSSGDAETRDAALDRKLVAYLAFVRSGQLVKSLPAFAGAPVLIQVICGGTPTRHMNEIEAVDDGRTRLPVEVMTTEEFFRHWNAEKVHGYHDVKAIIAKRLADALGGAQTLERIGI
jgi:hypothetical protein